MIPGIEISSSLPRNGDTYVAPALAARRAWFAEKISVTFVLIPSAERTLTALRPSTVIGILTIMFGWIAAISLPSLIMPSASTVVALTSPLIGPSTIDVISLITSLKSLPSLAIRDGFVVTPQITPMSFAFLMSSTFAVSIKNFIFYPPHNNFLSLVFYTAIRTSLMQYHNNTRDYL